MINWKNVAYNFILIMIGVCIAWGLSYASPSDMLSWQGDKSVVPLHNVLPSSAKAIDATNENLTMFQDLFFPNIGHYASWAVRVTDYEPPVTSAQAAFLGTDDTAELQGVGNATRDITILNSTSGGLVYL